MFEFIVLIGFVLFVLLVLIMYEFFRIGGINMFKKKNEKEEIEKTNVIDGKLKEKEKHPLDDVLAKFEKYREAYSPNDVANMGNPVIKAEELNLLFAVFCELQELKEIIKSMNEE